MRSNNFNKQLFSFFKQPVTNTTPYRSISLFDAYRAICGDYLKEQTMKLRRTSNQEENKWIKTNLLDFVTFSGVFAKRSDAGLTQYSNYLVLDFDHLRNVEKIKPQLLKDPYFETELLFTSPNGNGLKWVVSTETRGKLTHGEFFDAVKSYVQSSHGIEVDKSGRDIARACFLCHDPKAYIHPKYLINETNIQS